ncbi:hypothetical protein [Dapis sp. BLCC M172]|uniref:hypothetical protein n=1 Tax=Dapis sp. BLCC M172 TaxID=2975281 RepID=UPI003CEEB839
MIQIIFFSEQTRKQIDIGIDVSNFAKEEDANERKDYQKVLNDLINQCLSRDEGWKEFYKEKMEEPSDEAGKFQENILEILELERKAEEGFYYNEPENAINHLRKIIDNYCKNDKTEQGWYLQILARYKYKISKADSNSIQKEAWKKNEGLLKPKEGINYKKLSDINDNRMKRIKDWISKQKTYEELMLTVNDILGNLSFGIKAQKFEKALQDLGSAIGFLSERPEKKYKTSPDNLWCVSKDYYFIFECKSEVEDLRSEIYKYEVDQMNDHCGWFDKEYETDQVKRILIMPTKNVSYQGNFTHYVKIMRKEKLKSLRDNVRDFFQEFKDYKLNEISDSKIQELIQVHKLDIDSLKREYSEDYYQKKWMTQNLNYYSKI